jgi:hypothetical protein
MHNNPGPTSMAGGMIRRTDSSTAQKMSVVLGARKAFGVRFARRLALNAGAPAGLVHKSGV